MKFNLRVGLLNAVLATIPDEYITGQVRYQDDNKRVTLDVKAIDEDFLAALKKEAEQTAKVNRYDRAFLRVLENYEVLNAEFVGTTVTRLEHVVSAIKNYFEESPNKWVFENNSVDDQSLPMYLSDATYYADEWEYKNKKRELISEAYVRLTCNYIHRGQKLTSTKTFHRRDINRDGTTLQSMFRKIGWMKETRAAFAKYAEQTKRMQAIAPQTGRQFAAYGVAQTLAGRTWYSNASLVQMVRDGRPSKVVMDDENDEGRVDRSSKNGGVSPNASLKFWNGSKVKTRRKVETSEDVDDMYLSDDQDFEYDETVLPVWPYVKVFDLSLHVFLEMHVEDLQDYPFDKTAFDKLILPENHKSLLSILVNGTAALMEDIVVGKTGGIIILTTGMPGVGKTLTAEVYSEFIERPVYSVQCTQLGIGVIDIEKNLTAVLQRAQRWNALLLLDEADVYIRHRGHDLAHNAIVGVFLRILEYYRGVLFMTSNRATIIDPAVLSRVTAHIKYPLPDAEHRRKIWQVLANQYEVTFTDEQYDALVDAFPDVAGRDIKSMLKLVTLMTRQTKQPVTLELLQVVYEFQDTATTMDTDGLLKL